MEKDVFNEEVERRERSRGRFWEREEPETVEANRLQWSFYRRAGKLQLFRYYGYDKRQFITLDKRAITPEMVEILKKFINLCEERKGE
ncbi:MAG TPA: hypothetical protein DIV40_05925 [Clostridiales bacterium]|nr:hypothetical protein [Clostridiales bacterium]